MMPLRPPTISSFVKMRSALLGVSSFTASARTATVSVWVAGIAAH